MTEAARRVKRSRQRGRKVEREWMAAIDGYSGGSDPDVITGDEVDEVKSHNCPPPKTVTGPMEQALRNVKGSRRPVVVHRWRLRDGRAYWEIRLRPEDYIGLVKAEREMAALAVQAGVAPRDVDLRQLQEALRGDDVVLDVERVEFDFEIPEEKIRRDVP